MMNVYFTVDTESSMGGAWRHPERRPLSADRHVFCRDGDRDFGVPMLVRLLKRFDLRGTFFVETLATRCLGEADTRSIFDFLLREEQDVQLHIHPNFRFYSESRQALENGVSFIVPKNSDHIGLFEEDVQLDLLTEAADYFEKYCGRRATAFRAGNYAGSSTMMRCLGRLGVVVDSSFNASFHKSISFPGEPLQPNKVETIEGVWEIPVTVARTKLPESNGFKIADCTSLCFPEIRAMLDAGFEGGQEHFVFVFHSFSAVKPKDETYAELRPNRIVIRRLENLFRYLAENSDRFRVETMGAIAAAPQTLAEATTAAPVAELNLLSSVVRKAIQRMNDVYWI